jgi:hypothetical protein
MGTAGIGNEYYTMLEDDDVADEKVSPWASTSSPRRRSRHFRRNSLQADRPLAGSPPNERVGAYDHQTVVDEAAEERPQDEDSSSMYSDSYVQYRAAASIPGNRRGLFSLMSSMSL